MERNLEYLVIDVDGTLTDAGIYYDENGNEQKKFSTKDAAGFFAAKKVGIKTIVLTGRSCKATERRMKELNVDYFFQNVKDKKSFLEVFMKNNDIERIRVGYIGDDLNDLPAMLISGFVGCPCDACGEVRSISSYISPYKGGYGAVRDVIEHILLDSGEWVEAINCVYGIGI